MKVQILPLLQGNITPYSSIGVEHEATNFGVASSSLARGSMRYFGGKSLIAKDIANVISQYRKDEQIYVEPFVGGGWVLVEVSGKRLAIDKNPYLISLWKALQDGWIPPETVSEQEYIEVKNGKETPAHIKAFIGFGCSFGGKWFGGYGRDCGGRNYAREARNSLLRKVPFIKEVEFSCSDYRDLKFSDCLIYCDPPYDGCADYTQTGKFNSGEFWEVARRWSANNTIIVSEYNAPQDFKCVWERSVAVSATNLSTRKRARAIEKLYIYRSC